MLLFLWAVASTTTVELSEAQRFMNATGNMVEVAEPDCSCYGDDDYERCNCEGPSFRCNCPVGPCSFKRFAEIGGSSRSRFLRLVTVCFSLHNFFFSLLVSSSTVCAA